MPSLLLQSLKLISIRGETYKDAAGTDRHVTVITTVDNLDHHFSIHLDHCLEGCVIGDLPITPEPQSNEALLPLV